MKSGTASPTLTSALVDGVIVRPASAPAAERCRMRSIELPLFFGRNRNSMTSPGRSEDISRASFTGRLMTMALM